MKTTDETGVAEKIALLREVEREGSAREELQERNCKLRESLLCSEEHNLTLKRKCDAVQQKNLDAGTKMRRMETDLNGLYQNYLWCVNECNRLQHTIQSLNQFNTQLQANIEKSQLTNITM